MVLSMLCRSVSLVPPVYYAQLATARARLVSSWQEEEEQQQGQTEQPSSARGNQKLVEKDARSRMGGMCVDPCLGSRMHWL